MQTQSPVFEVSYKTNIQPAYSKDASITMPHEKKSGKYGSMLSYAQPR